MFRLRSSCCLQQLDEQSYLLSLDQLSKQAKVLPNQHHSYNSAAVKASASNPPFSLGGNNLKPSAPLAHTNYSAPPRVSSGNAAKPVSMHGSNHAPSVGGNNSRHSEPPPLPYGWQQATSMSQSRQMDPYPPVIGSSSHANANTNLTNLSNAPSSPAPMSGSWQPPHTSFQAPNKSMSPSTMNYAQDQEQHDKKHFAAGTGTRDAIPVPHTEYINVKSAADPRPASTYSSRTTESSCLFVLERVFNKFVSESKARKDDADTIHKAYGAWSNVKNQCKHDGQRIECFTRWLHDWMPPSRLALVIDQVRKA